MYNGLMMDMEERVLKSKHEPILENIDPNAYRLSRWRMKVINLDLLLSKVGTSVYG